jgi:hypothetical protein
MDLYHATSSASEGHIREQLQLRCGSEGIFGAGIYFAAAANIARAKSRFGRNANDHR